MYNLTTLIKLQPVIETVSDAVKSKIEKSTVGRKFAKLRKILQFKKTPPEILECLD
jgi:hypothetical protein